MKAILLMLVCTSLAISQQVQNTIIPKERYQSEIQKKTEKWRKKLNQLRLQKLQKAQKYVSKSKESLSNESLNVNEAASSYDVPFASKDNEIEILIANTSQNPIDGIVAEITSTPDCLKFTKNRVDIETLGSKSEKPALFTFSVDKFAELNKERKILFTISDKTGQKWTKELSIKITPPAVFELMQNYPNPFNPATTIEYQLPGSGINYSVSLKIYDVIGREVANIVNEQQEPGYYKKTFDASRYASGVYIYRLIASDEQHKQHVFQKKMVLLR